MSKFKNKVTYRLHYGLKENCDIQSITCRGCRNIEDHIRDLLYNAATLDLFEKYEDKVFILSLNIDNYIEFLQVEKADYLIISAITDNYKNSDICDDLSRDDVREYVTGAIDVFLLVHNSYEEAYSVAADIRELHADDLND